MASMRKTVGIGITAVLVIIVALVLSHGRHAVKISRQEYGDRWPFTVEEGILDWEATPTGTAVTFTANGVTYAVNGTAMTAGKYADIEPIWAADPKGLWPKKDIGPIIDRGLELAK